MTDPVIRDLNRHLAQVEYGDAIQENAERLLEDDPDTYGDMDESELMEAAERDLQDQAEAAAEARAEAMAEERYLDY